MNTQQSVTSDYKKWLLYSFDNQEFKTYYNLFTALKRGESFETTRISSTDNAGLKTYTISHDSVREDLQISEEQRTAFTRYLIDNYFHTENVDEAMADKRQQSEKERNHNYVGSPQTFLQDQETDFVIKPHPKETTYYNIKLTISIIVYLLIAGTMIYGALTDITFLIGLPVIILIVLIFMLLSKVTHGLFVGMIRGASIHVTKDQYPEIYKIVEEQARKLKMKELPEILITSGHFNAFVTRFSRKHILMIYSEVVETSLKGKDNVLKYVIGHELSHIKQRHLAKRKYLLPSSIIPFLNLAYSRGCEYTCDRVGYHFSPQGAVEGVLVMTTGKEIHSRFNIDLHIKNAVEHENFWTWFSEKFLTHPHHYKRLIAIKEYSKYNNS